MRAALATVLALAFASVAFAAYTGVATGGYRQQRVYFDWTDFAWTDAQGLAFQEQHRGYIALQYGTVPAGSPLLTGFGTTFNTLQGAYTNPRIALVFRPDVMVKYKATSTDTNWTVDDSTTCICATRAAPTVCGGGTNSCTSWGGDVTTCQGGSNPGTRCVVGDSLCTGGGTCGGAGETFDTAWVQTVPIAEHDALITARWGGDDPFDGGTSHNWNTALNDKTAITDLVTASVVPALYAKRTSDNVMQVIGVVMDVCNTSYQAWYGKYVVRQLTDLGISGSEQVAIAISDKPGWHEYYDGAAIPTTCRDAADLTYYGHLWGTLPASCTDSGPMPLHETQYTLGEYEGCMVQMFEAIDTALDAASLTGVKIMHDNGSVPGATSDAAGNDAWETVGRFRHDARFIGQVSKVLVDPLP